MGGSWRKKPGGREEGREWGGRSPKRRVGLESGEGRCGEEEGEVEGGVVLILQQVVERREEIVGEP